MVAITVILAAVIGTFVLGLGNQVGNSGPTASIAASDASATGGNITDAPGGNTVNLIELNHNSGDSLSDGNYEIQVRQGTSGSYTTIYDGERDNTSKTLSWTALGGSYSPASSGQDVSIGVNTDVGDFGSGDVYYISAYVTDVEDGGTGDGAESHYSESLEGEWSVQIVHPGSDTTVMQKTVTVS
jgi:FlaG/FlaF family flagellin (archaellin)